MVTKLDPKNFQSSSGMGVVDKNRIFHNCHPGDRCFILGTGPSIKNQNLQPLRNEICFGLSNVYKHPDFSVVRPRYYCIAAYHPPGIEENWHKWMKEIEEKTGDAVMFFSLSDINRNQRNGLFSGRQLYFLDYSGLWNNTLVHGIDLTRPLPGPMSGSVIPIMIAIYMGFKEIYLLGCDSTSILHFLLKGMHFFDKTNEWRTEGAGFNEQYAGSVEEEFHCMSRLWQQYKNLRQIALKNSVQIYNATKGGLLDVFPRVDYESLFPEAENSGKMAKEISSSKSRNQKVIIPFPGKDDGSNPQQINDIISIQPVSRQFGFDRGTPIDRYYIEKFLRKNRYDIHGRVLEVGDRTYTKKHGIDVIQSDVLNVAPNSDATIVGDLATGHNIPENAFDCIIMTQVIQMIFDVKASLKNAIKALKPGGTLLLTASGISQISRYDMDRWGEYWRFTDKSLRMLLSEIVPEGIIDVEAKGNVAVAKAFLDGRALHEIPHRVLEYEDNDYQVVLLARVHLPEKMVMVKTDKKQSSKRGEYFRNPLVLLYHRVCNDPIDSQLLAVSPEYFESHLRALTENYRVLSLRGLLNELRHEKYIPDTVALTFDDGYLDNLTNGLPLLEKYGVHATVFVSSGMIGSRQEFWWNNLQSLFFSDNRLPKVLSYTDYGKPKVLDLSTAANRLHAYDELAQTLQYRPSDEIDTFMKELMIWSGHNQDVQMSNSLLDFEQLRTLSSSPLIEIGSHCVNHVALSALSPEKQRYEIQESKRQLESIIEKQITLFSYPYGNTSHFTNETVKIVAEAGYEAGIANVQGNIVNPVNMYAIPRRLVRNWSGEVFSDWLKEENKDLLESETVSKRTIKLKGYQPGTFE